MSHSRRIFLVVAIGAVLTAGCSGVQRRPAQPFRRAASAPAVSSRPLGLGRVPEGDVEVVGPEVSSRVDPESGID